MAKGKYERLARCEWRHLEPLFCLLGTPISLTRETHESGGKNGLQAKAKVRAEAKAKAGALVSVAAFVAWPLCRLAVCACL